MRSRSWDAGSMQACTCCKRLVGVGSGPSLPGTYSSCAAIANLEIAMRFHLRISPRLFFQTGASCLFSAEERQMNLQLARAWLERDHLGFPTSNILLCSAATA